jgi:hypothetical protein
MHGLLGQVFRRKGIQALLCMHAEALPSLQIHREDLFCVGRALFSHHIDVFNDYCIFLEIPAKNFAFFAGILA